MMFIGFAGQTYQKESDVTIEKGQTTQLGRYSITYQGNRAYSDAQKEVSEVYLAIAQDGKPAGSLRPAKWSYRGHDDEPPRTIVTIRETLREDLYIILNGIDGDSGLASIKVIINPLVNWVWFGFFMLIIGTVIAFLPERAYDLVTRGAPATAATIAVLLTLAAPSVHAFSLAAAGESAIHMASAGNNFPTPPRSDLEKDLRKTLVCMCGCGRQTLAECTCGFAAKERALIARLIDEGKRRDEIIKTFTSRYPGESALVVPNDAGFNRLAWMIPLLGLAGAGVALGMAARRWTRNPALLTADGANPPPAATAGDKVRDQKYVDQLDDDLDDLT
jgi:cytochrome c-type biogenesis protein CcmF